jgi:hypothetical protein
VVIHANNGGDDSTRWEQASLPILGPIIAQCNMDKTIKYGKIGRRELESVVGKVYICIHITDYSSYLLYRTITNLAYPKGSGTQFPNARK